MTLRWALAAITLAATGCLSRHTEMMEEHRSAGETAYAASAIESARTISGAPAAEAPAPSAEKKELELRLSGWREAAGDEPRVADFLDLSTDRARDVRSWAADMERVGTALAGPLDLETLAVLAFSRNRAVRQAHEEWLSVLSRYEQAAYLDDLLGQYNAFAKSLDIPFGPMMGRGKEPIAESLPPPGALAKKGDVLDAEARMAREEYRLAVRDAVAEARKTYHELAYLDRAIEITRENQTILADIKAIVSVKYETGSAEYADVLRSQAEFDELENLLITLGTRRETARARLVAVLDLPAGAAVGPASPPPERPVEEAPAALALRAREENPELDKMEAGIVMMEAAIRLARERPYYKYVQRRYLFDLRGGMAEEGAGPEVPYWYGKEEAFLAEMEGRLQAAREELAAAANEVAFMTQEAYYKQDAGLRRVRLYRDSLVGKARQSLEATLAAYRAGKIDFVDVLDARRRLFEFELEEAEAVWDFNEEREELQRQVGRSF
ncbi:MAG: TolC family protein [Planctomycetes bacterium]|nr:TolC family protein [Planctomycetota bacterium]